MVIVLFGTALQQLVECFVIVCGALQCPVMVCSSKVRGTRNCSSEQHRQLRFFLLLLFLLLLAYLAIRVKRCCMSSFACLRTALPAFLCAIVRLCAFVLAFCLLVYMCMYPTVHKIRAHGR